MRSSIVIVMLLASTTPAVAQQLSVEDRACINSAVGKMPVIAAARIEGSRVVERRVIEQAQGRRKQNAFPVYRMKVEIDVNVAGHSSIYMFNCVLTGQMALIEPLGMR
jgi:hypothetical protein